MKLFSLGDNDDDMTVNFPGSETLSIVVIEATVELVGIGRQGSSDESEAVTTPPEIDLMTLLSFESVLSLPVENCCLFTLDSKTEINRMI